MAKKRICIIAKTYPRPSAKYDELVCTAGITKSGNWIRLYPIPFRKLGFDKQYSKFHWVEADITRNTKDFRPESYRLTSHDAIEIIDHVPADKDGTWAARRDLLLKNVYDDLATLITDAYDPEKRVSLAVFKPKKILKFKVKACDDREWKKSTLDSIKARALQVDLFAGAQNPFEVVEKIPYKFSYTFEDINGKQSTPQIIDWEIGQLFRNCLKDGEKAALGKVRKKYWDDFACSKDTYLILGTTLEHHALNAHNPFLIIGVFPPKVEVQTRCL
jgi:hypothetical protein